MRKIILISLLFSLCTFVGCAQTKKGVNEKFQAKNIHKLPEMDSINSKTSTLSPSCEQLLVTIDSLKKVVLSKETNTVDASKFKSVDDFLNRQDTLIFSSEYKSFKSEDILPRNRDYYALIQTVHRLDSTLSVVEKNLIEIDKSHELMKDSILTLPAKKSLAETISRNLRQCQTDLTKTFDMINLISVESCELTTGDSPEKYKKNIFFIERKRLSKEQWNFYSRLIDKYNNLVKKINSLTSKK